MPAQDSGLKMGFYGALGAVAPDVLVLYSKRFTMSSLTFSLPQYCIATALYVALASCVAAVYPYGRKRGPMAAIGVGFALPIVLSAAASFARAPVIVPRGMSMGGTLLDLLSLW
jgi:hypothetical protein